MKESQFNPDTDLHFKCLSLNLISEENISQYEGSRRRFSFREFNVVLYFGVMVSSASGSGKRKHKEWTKELYLAVTIINTSPGNAEP